MREEKWVKVKTIRGKFEISSYGRLRKYFKKYGKTPLIVRGGIFWTGYLSYNLIDKKVLAHRLVAEYFIPNPHLLPCINHKDGNKLNNNIDNLEWCSYGQNNLHAYKTGLKQALKGEKVHTSKLKNNDVLEIYNSNKKTIELSKFYKIDPSIVFDIKSGNTWKHITGGMNIMNHRKILSKDIILSVYNDKDGRAIVSQRYGVSKSHVTSIKNGTIHSDVTKHKKY